MSRYIDADKLTEEIKAWCEAMKKRGNETRAEDYEHCNDLIFQEPTADVRENVKGTWKIYCDDKGVVEDCYCDQCGFNSVIGGNYCPNCGADMRGDA